MIFDIHSIQISIVQISSIDKDNNGLLQSSLYIKRHWIYLLGHMRFWPTLALRTVLQAAPSWKGKTPACRPLVRSLPLRGWLSWPSPPEVERGSEPCRTPTHRWSYHQHPFQQKKNNDLSLWKFTFSDSIEWFPTVGGEAVQFGSNIIWGPEWNEWGCFMESSRHGNSTDNIKTLWL